MHMNILMHFVCLHSCTGPDADNPPSCNAQMAQTVQSNNYCGLLADKSGVFGACLTAAGAVSKISIIICIIVIIISSIIILVLCIIIIVLIIIINSISVIVVVISISIIILLSLLFIN